MKQRRFGLGSGFPVTFQKTSWDLIYSNDEKQNAEIRVDCTEDTCLDFVRGRKHKDISFYSTREETVIHSFKHIKDISCKKLKNPDIGKKMYKQNWYIGDKPEPGELSGSLPSPKSNSNEIEDHPEAYWYPYY